MRYALIGCGRISHRHIEAAKSNGLEFVALCDIVPGKARERANEFCVPDSVQCYTDYHEMLLREKPELVAVATSSGSHADIAVDCINAGCNVIIEKPIALSIADADRIIEAEKKNGVTVCVNQQNRFNEAIQQVRNAYLDGRFGKLLYGTTSIRWHRDGNYYQSGDWRGTWAQDGGTLMNQCIHAIDLLRWMLGDEIVEVVGMTDNQIHPYIEGEDFGIAMLHFKNGSYGLIDGTVNIHGGDYEETLTLFGEDGFVRVGGTCVNKIDEWRFSDNEHGESVRQSAVAENPPSVYGFGHDSVYADMIDSIKNKRCPYIDSSAGKRALETVLAIYKSAAEGRAVRLPLEHCSTLDFTGRFNK